jgi:hypothetical protein
MSDAETKLPTTAAAIRTSMNIEPVSTKQPVYLSYLLRLWRTPTAGEAAWRASLENPQTGERRGFASLDAMVAYLRRQIGLAPNRGGEEDEETISSEQGGN